MSNNQIVIETLVKQREQLVAAREAFLAQNEADIHEIDNAIQILTGHRESKPKSITLYDDESPDYIKSSQEEI